jgi:hypothetical protein
MVQVKKLIGYPTTYFLYGLGHLFSKAMHVERLGWLYPVYNHLMICSVDVQDWSKVEGPWGK